MYSLLFSRSHVETNFNFFRIFFDLLSKRQKAVLEHGERAARSCLLFSNSIHVSILPPSFLGYVSIYARYSFDDLETHVEVE